MACLMPMGDTFGPHSDRGNSWAIFNSRPERMGGQHHDLDIWSNQAPRRRPRRTADGPQEGREALVVRYECRNGTQRKWISLIVRTQDGVALGDALEMGETAEGRFGSLFG